EELERAKIDPEDFVGYNRDLYDGSIRGLDAEIGRLMQKLRDIGLADKTLVVFTGDHGEEFLEHGRTFHGQSTYGELGNVPLILWGAGVPRGTVVEDTVQDVDLYPTLLEMSRLAVPPGAQGHSLAPLLAPPPGRARHDEPAITEKAETHEVGGAPPPRDTASVAIVSGGFKLVHNLKRPRGGPEFELFDHRKDPLDRADVALEHPEVVERLAKDLAAWSKMADAARLKPDRETAAALKAEDLERLRALGYIQ
ncbi:MAG TPA: sulfatase-like hydrolase/transferase, partial [Vicinamibacteria bacterium]|nr:sulfatase-like hydrolase/transferase [Vicinamibacteria bacterium]